MRARHEMQAYEAAEKIISSTRRAEEQAKIERDRLATARSRGAESNRTMSYFSGWLGGSADSALLDELDDLKDRSRELVRSDPHASGLATIATDTTAGVGIAPRANLNRELIRERTGHTDDQINSISRNIAYEWRRFARDCDAQDRCDWDELTWMSIMTSLVDGDLFWHLTHINEPGRRYSLAIEAVDGDRVEDPRDTRIDDTRMRKGVELDAIDRPIAYWVSKQHPHEWRGNAAVARDFNRIERYRSGRLQFAHIYQTIRPGLNRGVPWLRPVIEYFANLADYIEAEIVAARVAACFAVFIKKASDAASAVRAHTQGVNEKGERLHDLSLGAIHYGEIGESVEVIDSKRQGADVGGFVTTILRAICTALRIPYESIDVSSANYSSARMATAQAAMASRRYRARFVSSAGYPVWRQFIEEAWLENRIGDFDFNADPDLWCEAQWVVKGGTAHVDPEKEARAAVIRVNNGFTTRDLECGHFSGQTFEENAVQLAQEETLIDELDLTIGEQAPEPAPAPEKPDTEDENDDEEESDDVRDS